MKKFLMAAMFFITLLPIMEIDGYSCLSAQNMTFEDGSWWLPDVVVDGKEKETCDICGNSYDADDPAGHECTMTCEYCREVVRLDRYEHHMETVHPNLDNDKSRCIWCRTLLTPEEALTHDCRNLTIPGDSGGSSGGGGSSGFGGSGGISIGGGTGGSIGSNTGRTIINSNKIDSKTLAFLNKMQKGGGKIVITSSQRSIESQAKAVLNNIKNRGVEYQKKVYRGKPGEKLCDAYNPAISYEDNLQNFINIINASSDPSIFSHHLGGYDWRCTFDISQSYLSNPQEFYKELLELKKTNSNILKVFIENGCIHIEYKIK